MDTDGLIQAAAAIAGSLAAPSFSTGNMKIQEIASTAVKIAREITREIEAEARRAELPSGTSSRPEYSEM
jgi:hypothetical protein